MRAFGIAAQDITRISFALLTPEGVEKEITVEAPPEEYLRALHETLRAWELQEEGIDAVAIVRGPGSFTAIRMSTVVGNTFAFTRELPILALENPARQDWQELAARLPWNGARTDAFAQPVYDRPPHITTP